MDGRLGLSRRRFLMGQASALTLFALAGCADADPSGQSDEEADSPSETTASSESTEASTTTETATTETATTDDSSDSPTGGSSTPPDDLDLSEANVVDVAFEQSGSSYSFDVTLHHDDDGEDGYANWWQVERLDGTQIGRRTLLHAHSTQPFTRSETIEIPEDVSCIVVRGHDQTHEYGGVAAVVTLDSGAVRYFDQGSEKQPFDEQHCP